MPLHAEGGFAVDLDRLDEAVVGTTDGAADRDDAVAERSMPWWWRLFTSISSPYTA